jgi:hypothetical protein
LACSEFPETLSLSDDASNDFVVVTESSSAIHSEIAGLVGSRNDRLNQRTNKRRFLRQLHIGTDSAVKHTTSHFARPASLESQSKGDVCINSEKEFGMSRLSLVTFLIFLIALCGMAHQPEEKPSAKESIPADSSTENPYQAAQLLRAYRRIRIETGTWLAKPEMCEGALQMRREFEVWELGLTKQVFFNRSTFSRRLG